MPCATLNKVCGSGMKAAMLAHDMIVAGSADLVVAGGMESMSNAPYLLEKARGGYRMGHGRVVDHMFLDGLENTYDKGRSMGTFAEDCAEAYQFTREAQDGYALESLDRTRQAVSSGAETVAVGNTREDEAPGRARPEKIPTLKPAFREGGTVTAANSSSISDGAAAMVLMRESAAEARGVTPPRPDPRAFRPAQAPALFTTAPIFAIRKLLERLGWQAQDVEL